MNDTSGRRCRRRILRTSAVGGTGNDGVDAARGARKRDEELRTVAGGGTDELGRAIAGEANGRRRGQEPSPQMSPLRGIEWRLDRSRFLGRFFLEAQLATTPMDLITMGISLVVGPLGKSWMDAGSHPTTTN